MKKSKLPRFFDIVKRSEPNRFSYQPRYYNERKEDIERRKKILDSSDDELSNNVRARMEVNIENKWKRDNFTKQSGRANMRLMLILGVLLYVAYIIFTQIDQVSIFFE